MLQGGVAKKKANGASGAASKPLAAKIRGLQRLINKPGLPDDVRAAKEAEVKALLQQKDVLASKKSEQKFAKRYHKIKFFERRKAVRRIAALQKQLASSPENSEVTAMLEQYQLDLQYIMRYPKNRKYVALYADTGDGDSNAQLARRKELTTTLLASLPPEGSEENTNDAEDEDVDPFFLTTGPVSTSWNNTTDEEDLQDDGDDEQQTRAVASKQKHTGEKKATRDKIEKKAKTGKSEKRAKPETKSEMGTQMGAATQEKKKKAKKNKPQPQ